MIFITGDTHIPIDVKKLGTRSFPLQKDLTKSDYVIICGDFGGVWNNDSEEMYWRKWLESKSFTTLFVDGNHENHPLLSSFETVDLFGGKAHKISDSVYHLMRGQIFDIDGKRFFTLGGAASHDRGYRVEGKSWWKEELPSPDELDEATRNLQNVDFSVDFVITHCAPTSVQSLLSKDYRPDLLTDYFEDLKAKLSFQKWFFGHYHIDKMIDKKYRAIYDDIARI
ncbi:MAG: metallophosphoesterase [Ruminococcaceae bacterium]|nr:metallophosphoesterase [Oscillospiraceae bacterium]